MDENETRKQTRMTGMPGASQAVCKRGFIENIMAAVDGMRAVVKSVRTGYCVIVDLRTGTVSTVPAGPDTPVGSHEVKIQNAHWEPGTGRVAYSSEKDAVDARMEIAWVRYSEYRVNVLGEPAP